MRRWGVLGLLVLLLSTAWAGEQMDLTTPDQATAGTPTYYIARLDLDWDGARVTIHLNSSSGIRKSLTFSGTEATSYMKAANKRDFTTISLHRWTLNQLKAKGWLDGTVSGTPD